MSERKEGRKECHLEVSAGEVREGCVVMMSDLEAQTWRGQGVEGQVFQGGAV